MVGRHNALARGLVAAVALVASSCGSDSPYEVGQRERDADAVEARSNLVRVRPASWSYVRIGPNREGLVQFYVSTDPNCGQLAQVTQTFDKDRIVLTVLVGDVRTDEICSLAGRQAEASFKLEESRRGRRVVDGSKDDH
jgi:hypothetical protein